MPLSKQAKALYEAALRRKGLQPGKAVRRDPRTFVGPIDLSCERYRPLPVPSWYETVEGYITDSKKYPTPRNTYWDRLGRFQDLEDELQAAMDAGIWERRNPVEREYARYWDKGYAPRRMVDLDLNEGNNYEDPRSFTYRYPTYRILSNGTRYSGDRSALTRLGQLELEARYDEMVENDYKNYLRKMLQRFPNRAAVREEFPEEYNAMPYLENLFPEE